MKKMMTKKNIVNAIFIALFLVILFVPSAKAFLIQGLMEIGLFKPKTEPIAAETPSADLSGIKFEDKAGKVIDLGALKGKVIFINFWATWCPPCLAEMPSINKLYEQYKDDKDVVFIMVDADSDLVKSQKYMDGRSYKMPVYSVASNIPETLFKGTLPTTIVFDKQGRLSYNESGAANYASSKFIEFIEQLKSLKI
ncbi:TlpA disulfide reductase family protein [Pedobacter sp. B4-66]|uniref:TlpA family protein disulfide reductase n=1 Tax=Pedobacter sp. B4-66 TaxID=2817280 RepID=UPI001BDA1BA5|nr:TlpA disulfide reductase family protein [Pedobacter sp. B4-66]